MVIVIAAPLLHLTTIHTAGAKMPRTRLPRAARPTVDAFRPESQYPDIDKDDGTLAVLASNAESTYEEGENPQPSIEDYSGLSDTESELE
jgi:hypothetical protein